MMGQEQGKEMAIFTLLFQLQYMSWKWNVLGYCLYKCFKEMKGRYIAPIISILMLRAKEI